MQKLQLAGAGVSFCLWRRGDPESKLKCCVAIQALLIPNSPEGFLRFGVCGGLLARGDLTSSRTVLCPREKSGTLLWRFLGSSTSSFETVLRND